MIEAGWSAVYRKIWENPIFKGRSDRVGAWLWLIHTACFKPTTQDANGTMVDLQRGQLCVSRKQICDGTGLTEKEVRNLLDCLERAEGIRREYVGGRAKGRSIITIRNYDVYHPQPKEGGQGSGQAGAKEGPTKEQGNKSPSLRSGDTSVGEKKKKTDRGTRLPEDWMPEDAEIEFAMDKHGLTEQEVFDAADEFKDYWLGVPGAKGRKLDWPRTFKNRIRERAGTIRRRRGGNGFGNGVHHSTGQSEEVGGMAGAIMRRRRRNADGDRGSGGDGTVSEGRGFAYGSGGGGTVIDARPVFDDRGGSRATMGHGEASEGRRGVAGFDAGSLFTVPD